MCYFQATLYKSEWSQTTNGYYWTIIENNQKDSVIDELFIFFL